MDTPVQQIPGEPGVAAADDETAKIVGSADDGVAAALVSGMMQRAQGNPGQVVPPDVPSVPQAPKAPPAQPKADPAQAAAPAAPQIRDFESRFGGSAPADPTASLESLPELAPEQPIEPPQNLDDKQNHAWAAMRAQMSEYRRQAEDFRQKYNGIVDSAKKYQGEKTEFGNQLNAKDTRIKELEDEIGRMDLSRSSQFKEKYDAPLTGLRDKISELLIANGYEQGQSTELAESILMTESAKVPEMLSNLPSHVQGMIMIHSQNADKLWADREQALTDWKQSADGLAAVAARGSAVISAQHVSQLADKAIALAKGLPADQLAPAFQVTEDAGFVAERDAQEQKFKAWVHQAPEEQKYAAMFEGFMGGMTYKMLQQTWLENQELKRVLYQRGRLGTPPIAATRDYGVPPQAAPQPPVAPTVSGNGYASADSGDGAMQYAERFLSQLANGRPNPQ